MSLIWVILILWLIVFMRILLNPTHSLMILLLLESLFLLSLSAVPHIFELLFNTGSIFIFIFTLAVIEASLGLGLLVFVIRDQGTESLSHFYTC